MFSKIPPCVVNDILYFITSGMVHGEHMGSTALTIQLYTFLNIPIGQLTELFILQDIHPVLSASDG
jgi:hypothetical protein